MSDEVAALQARPARLGRGLWLAEAGLLLMAVMWGVNFSVIKYGTTVMPAMAYNAARILLAAFALVLIASIWGGPLPRRRDVFALVALGVLGNGVYQVLFIEGLDRTLAGEAALVVGASPALMALIGRMKGVEQVSRRGAAGIALSIFGVGLVVLGRASQGGGGVASGGSLVGDLLVLCGSVCWAFYTILLIPYTRRVTGWWITALTIVGGTFVLLLFGSSQLARVAWRALPSSAWIAMAYSGLGGLVVAYMFWYYGVRRLGPVRTALYGNLQPLIALVVAWLTLGELPTTWQALGAGTIVGGVLLTRMPASEAT